MKTIQCAVVLASVLTLASPALSMAAATPSVPAVHSSVASSAMMLGATRIGSRVIAVGDHGVVLLSDDQGQHFRQASKVPVSIPLTALSFIDERTGWAVGHGGAILLTQDGGDTWSVQRFTSDEDRPLFGVHFFNANEGVAVGLWSLVLVTRDGGRTWSEEAVTDPKEGGRADLNLLSLFSDDQGRVYATAERGQVLRSDDRGMTWQYLDTGYSGSLWTGAALPGGELLVGGQRGTLMRSSDQGQSWYEVALPTKSSITDIAVEGGRINLVGLDGFLAYSTDKGRSFVSSVMAEGGSFTAVESTERGLLLFSKRGVIPVDEDVQEYSQ